MKRTGPGVLLVAAVIGLVVGFGVDQLLVASGRPTFTPMITLPVVLVGLGVIVVALAIPIYRASRGHTKAPINPFRAVRIAMLAKASSIVGAALGGAGVGMLLYVLSRPTEHDPSVVGMLIATAVCGAVLIVAGLVAEHLCTIRKDDDDPEGSAPDGGSA
ncbi:hypothetical protein LK09_14490 [Microbacterium mangrovi]|uniref:DUF3180 domain-containing protein n=1 Tax=Microbacterium mangrovi TaxID=1348253 RepID=A0A0B2A4P9_9MICO|nr:DUF3180 domain-containing protein [Microbacterium mangrovi]KHK96553.1 hypothetical protein LK09_14490 [Microbacterium mangrovi]